jgi:hypothetical protein
MWARLGIALVFVVGIGLWLAAVWLLLQPNPPLIFPPMPTTPTDQAMDYHPAHGFPVR